MRNFSVDYTPADVKREKIAAGSCTCSQLHWRSDVGRARVFNRENRPESIRTRKALNPHQSDG
jgi:hypothetical protein